ncbi:MAG TPA: flagellar hook-associated protein FlgL [Janthinobacterium sp.]|nr:flagellar hook-associated protein FlgL [Janthinobacterium sp.]
MRISSMQFQSIMDASMNLNQGALSTLTQQMASGNRILLPSDDPVASVQLSRLNREVTATTQYQSNIATVQSRMSLNETYMQSTVNQMQSIKDSLVWASDGSNSSQDLNAQVNTLTAARDSLLSTANSQDTEGNYLFSGTLTSTPAITFNPAAPVGSRYTYTGNTANQTVVVGNGVTQTENSNMQGMDVYLNQLDSAISALAAPGVTLDAATSATLKTALDGTNGELDQMASQIAVLGGAQTTLTTLNTNHSNVNLSNNTAISNLASLDYAQASTQLSGYNVALQASYKAYAMIGKLTLFNELP